MTEFCIFGENNQFANIPIEIFFSESCVFAAAPADISMMHVFVVNYKPEYALTLGPILKKFFKRTPYLAQSMFGVQSLILPDFMIEIEAIAIIHE